MLHTFEKYSAEIVTVTVEWIQQLGAMYNASVLPPAPLMFNGTSSVQLVLEYNTEYNLSVVAVSPCTNVTGFATATLNYGKMFCMLSSNNHY